MVCFSLRSVDVITWAEFFGWKEWNPERVAQILLSLHIPEISG
jgi:hypothetical protein